HVIDRRDAGSFDGSLIVADDREKVSVAYELDRPFGGAAYGLLVNCADCGATVWLPDNTCVHHPVKVHIVDERTFAEYLPGQIHASSAGSDASEIGYVLALALARGLDAEIDRARQGPVVLPRRGAAAKKATIANRQFIHIAANNFGSLIEK